MKILLLATNHKAIAVRMMAKELKKRKVEYDILNPSQLFLMISNSENGRNRLFDDLKGETIRKLDISKYDIIIPRIGKDVDYCCEVLAYLEEVFGLRTVQTSEAINSAFSKIRSAIHLRASGIRTPKTFYINNIKNADIVLSKLSKEGKYVIKLDKGSKGKQVSIVTGLPEAKSVLDTIGSMNKQMIIQEYVESDGYDIRAIVIDGEVVAAYKRLSPKTDLRTNIATGGEGQKVKLTDREKQFCIDCASAVGLDIAGIDLMKDSDGKMYCIEVNHCPGMNVQKFTPISIAGQIVDYAIRFAEQSETEIVSNLELRILKNAYNETYNSKEFRKLYKILKNKVVESKRTGLQQLISSQADLQKLLIANITVN
jgi:ribosomal protein S6--L-glutamate ligase